MLIFGLWVWLGSLWSLFPLTSPYVHGCNEGGYFLVSTYTPPSLSGTVDDLYRSANGPFLKNLQKAVTSCCHSDSKIKLHRIYDTLRSLEEYQENETFLVPVSRSMSHLAAAGQLIPDRDAMMFLPMLESPGAFLFVNVKSDYISIAMTIAAAWPIFLLMIVSSGFSAIIIWALDRRYNPSSFPKSFVKGCWEGIWWAVVSMTTVGYGDRTPVSIGGRIFGMLWILIGVVIMSVFTATLTTSFASGAATLATVAGLDVGVLSGSAEEDVAFLLGANVTDYKHLDDLIEDVKADVLDATLLNNIVVLTQSFRFNDGTLKSASFVPAPAVHGALIKGLEDEEFFHCLCNFADRNRFRLLDDLREKSLPLSRRKGRDGADQMSNMLSSSLVIGYTLSALLVVCMVGLWVWEYWQVRKMKKTSNQMQEELRNQSMRQYPTAPEPDNSSTTEVRDISIPPTFQSRTNDKLPLKETMQA